MYEGYPIIKQNLSERDLSLYFCFIIEYPPVVLFVVGSMVDFSGKSIEPNPNVLTQ